MENRIDYYHSLPSNCGVLIRVMRAMALNLSKYHIRYTVERGMGANDRPDVRGALFAGGDCSERVSLSEGGEHQPRV